MSTRGPITSSSGCASGVWTMSSATGLLGTRPSYELMRDCDTLLTIGSSFPCTRFMPEFGKARAVRETVCDNVKRRCDVRDRRAPADPINPEYVARAPDPLSGTLTTTGPGVP